MRIALISDMHAHAIALAAVLADMRTQAVDQIVCLGDVATIGFQPKETLTMLRQLNCLCLMGNHDAALLEPQRAAEFQIAPELLPNLQWCAGHLAAADFNFLQTFQPLVELSLGADDSLLCFHGSPRSNTDLIVATTAVSDLNHLLNGHRAAILAGGHSHVQMLRQHQGAFILNPGSVGNPFRAVYTPGQPPTLNPWAEYAIVTWQSGALSVDCRRVFFDLQATRAAIIASDMPNKAWWLAQYS